MLCNLKNCNVYHGSFMEVRYPDLSKCQKGKDFGKGFYITTDRKQAISFAKNVARQNGYSKGVLNIYKFSDFQNLNLFEFENANEDWLNCIIGYRFRNFKNLSYPFKNFEVIIGKIADDNTSFVINAYMNGVFGPVGSKMAQQDVIKHLMPEKLKNQICFKSEKSLKKLKFFRSEDIWL